MADRFPAHDVLAVWDLLHWERELINRNCCKRSFGDGKTGVCVCYVIVGVGFISIRTVLYEMLLEV